MRKLLTNCWKFIQIRQYFPRQNFAPYGIVYCIFVFKTESKQGSINIFCHIATALHGLKLFLEHNGGDFTT